MDGTKHEEKWPQSSEELLKKSVATGLEAINLTYGIDWIHSSDAPVTEETINENAGMTNVPESMVETEVHSTKRGGI